MLRTTVVLLVLAALSACAGSAPTRPVLVATFPADGSSVGGIVLAVRLTYDGDVKLLDKFQVVANTDGSNVTLLVRADPSDARSVLLIPNNGVGFLPGETKVSVQPGLVVNGSGNYPLNYENFAFMVEPVPSVFLASGDLAAVVEADADTFSSQAVTSTPGGRTPVGLAGTWIGSEQRMWVQLEDGGGTGRALAWYEPGALTMNEVQLTFSPGGGLEAAAPAIVQGDVGEAIYVAYRDTAAGRVRLARVDTRTATETDSILLSPAASLETAPQGITIATDGSVLHLTCTAADGDRLVGVDTGTFTETDLGPDSGVDGVPLPEGAGPVILFSSYQLVAPLGKSMAHVTRVRAAPRQVNEYPTDVPGATVAVLLAADGGWSFDGLAGFAGDEALVARDAGDLDLATPQSISDEVSGRVTTTTAVDALVQYPDRMNFLALLDSDVVAVFTWDAEGAVQVDLDDATAGIQSVDLEGVAPGASTAAFLGGVRPP